MPTTKIEDRREQYMQTWKHYYTGSPRSRVHGDAVLLWWLHQALQGSLEYIYTILLFVLHAYLKLNNDFLKKKERV